MALQENEEDVYLQRVNDHHHPNRKPEEHSGGSADAGELPLCVQGQLQGVCRSREAKTSGGEFH